MADEFDKLIEDAGAKIANAVVTFAILRASRGRGRPDLIALKLIEAVVRKSAKDAGLGADNREVAYAKSHLKSASYKALFLEFDRIIESDGWESLPIPFDQWAAEACVVAKASAERAVLEMEENNSARTVKRLIKSASDDVQKAAAANLAGWPLPRKARVAIVSALCEQAGKTFDGHVGKLFVARGTAHGGRA